MIPLTLAQKLLTRIPFFIYPKQEKKVKIKNTTDKKAVLHPFFNSISYVNKINPVTQENELVRRAHTYHKPQ